MVEDNARIPINMTEPVELNLKIESYTIIGDADEIYNRGYADGEAFGKENAPTDDLSITLTSNGTFNYPKPNDKYYADVEVTVNVPSDKMPTQEKSITITKNGSEVISPDEGYVLDKVTVVTNIDTRLPEQEKSLEVTENKVYEVVPDDGYALKKVTVTGNVAGSNEEAQGFRVTMISPENWYYTTSNDWLYSNIASIEWLSSDIQMSKLSFSGFLNMKSCDLSRLDISSFTSFSNMFSDCRALTDIAFPKWDTSNITSFDSMFSSCHSLQSLDLSSFDTSKVTSMSSMFYSCSKLTNVIFGNNWASNAKITSFDTKYVPLSKASILDLASKIADKSDKTIYTSTYTVKLRTSQQSLFTEDELTALANQFTAKNWTLAWGIGG